MNTYFEHALSFEVFVYLEVIGDFIFAAGFSKYFRSFVGCKFDETKCRQVVVQRPLWKRFMIIYDFGGLE